MEYESFIPLAFSGSGRLSRKCSRSFSHTAECIANRRKEPKSKVSAWIKARLNFSLIRSMLLSLREQEHSQTLIISAKLICVLLLLRVSSNESLTDSFHITSRS